MKVGKLYIFSLLFSYFLFVICGILIMFVNNGIDDSLWKGITLLVISGIIYLPIFALSNVTQFIVRIKPNKKILAFFSSILIIGIISLVGIRINMMDDFLWKIFLPTQSIISLIAFYYYKNNIEKNSR